ncbi:MAG: hypothetical protein WEB37_07110 [Bacteroidota bacterium]
MRTESFDLVRGTLLLIASLFFSSATNAQHDPDSLKQAWPDALQFHMIGGYAASYITNLEGDLSVRFTADVAVDHSVLGGLTTDENSSFGLSQYLYDTTTDKTIYSIDLVASVVYPLRVSSRTDIFVGVGPAARFSRTYVGTEHIRRGTQPMIESNKSEINDRGIGARAIVGIQSPLTTTISILGEFQVSGLRIWRHTRMELTDWYGGTINFRSLDEVDQKGWEFIIHNLRLGISIQL